MSVQTCLPTGCKPRHSISQVAKTPSFLRHGSSRQNLGATTKTKSANRRSAVERLEESKANYVKSERVLDSKQEFKHSSHLHVSNGPHLDRMLKATPKLEPIVTTTTNYIHETVPLAVVPAPELVTPLVSRSPTRTRAKSHSEGHDPPKIRRNLSFASHENHRRIRTLVDIESQLKLLLSSSSKENVADPHNDYVFSNPAQDIVKAQHVPIETPKVRRGYSDPTHSSCFDEPESDNPYSIYKSMPNLSPPRILQSKRIFIDNSETNYKSNPRTAVTRTLSPRHVLPKEEDSPPLNTSRRFSNGTGTLHLTPYIPQSPSHSYQRHIVSRSKSDVSHRCVKRNSEYVQKKNNYTSAEIERFFDTMGLEATAWQHVSSPASVSSPPCFFQSISSIDSNDHSSNSSVEALPIVSKEGLRNFDLRGHGPVETSIVEKNARVIKWLYNCKKAGQTS